MEECEICGKKSSDIYIVNVEDVELRVCTKCAKGRKIVARVADRQTRQKQAVAREKKPDFEQLVDNYGSIIHKARESMRLPIKVLAEMINEKETLLLRVEQQKTMPSEELRKKLEKALGVRLVENVQQESEQRGGRGNSESATLGEFIGK
jgi:putative transcription factor